MTAQLSDALFMRQDELAEVSSRVLPGPSNMPISLPVPDIAGPVRFRLQIHP